MSKASDYLLSIYGCMALTLLCPQQRDAAADVAAHPFHPAATHQRPAADAMCAQHHPPAHTNLPSIQPVMLTLSLRRQPVTLSSWADAGGQAGLTLTSGWLWSTWSGASPTYQSRRTFSRGNASLIGSICPCMRHGRVSARADKIKNPTALTEKPLC